MKGIQMSGVMAIAVLSLWAGGRRLEAQCNPPAGTYSMSAVQTSGSFCVGNTVTFDIVGSSTGGSIQGFGFNITLTGVAVTINSVLPGFNPAGGVFAKNVNASGNMICALGSPQVGSAGLTTLATISVTPTAAGSVAIAFNGTLALTGGVVPGNHIVVAGCDAVAPTLTLNGTTLKCPKFIRGDCNNNGLVAGFLGDPIFLLNYLFLGGPYPPCAAACDANDDGNVAVDDAIFILSYQMGGSSPPAPFGGFPGACNTDPNNHNLSCLTPICP